MFELLENKRQSRDSLLNRILEILSSRIVTTEVVLKGLHIFPVKRDQDLHVPY